MKYAILVLLAGYVGALVLLAGFWGAL